MRRPQRLSGATGLSPDGKTSTPLASSSPTAAASAAAADFAAASAATADFAAAAPASATAVTAADPAVPLSPPGRPAAAAAGAASGVTMTTPKRAPSSHYGSVGPYAIYHGPATPAAAAAAAAAVHNSKLPTSTGLLALRRALIPLKGASPAPASISCVAGPVEVVIAAMPLPLPARLPEPADEQDASVASAASEDACAGGFCVEHDHGGREREVSLSSSSIPDCALASGTTSPHDSLHGSLRGSYDSDGSSPDHPATRAVAKQPAAAGAGAMDISLYD